MQGWYRNIEGKFDLPIRISKDCEYYPSLKKELVRYVRHLQNIVHVPQNVVDEISVLCNEILNAIDLYYKADAKSAQEKVLQVLLRYIDKPFVISKLDKSYSFRGLAPFLNENLDGNDEQIKRAFSTDLSFFKARVADDPVTRFLPEEMLHIPFTERGKVKTQRFSIVGLPCLYFGSSSYVCWIELGKPQDNFFNVCSYKIDGSLKVLNLVNTWHLICGLASGVTDNDFYMFDLDELTIDLLKLWPLVCATSYKIEEHNRFFKSEYIISQLIMLCLNELNIDGVAYISKQSREDTTAYPNCVNLAIPAKHDNYRFSQICNKIKLTCAVNFGEFKKLNAIESHPRKKSYINHYFTFNRVEMASRQIMYSTSVFGRFDDYLVSMDHQTVEIERFNRE